MLIPESTVNSNLTQNYQCVVLSLLSSRSVSREIHPLVKNIALHQMPMCPILNQMPNTFKLQERCRLKS